MTALPIAAPLFDEAEVDAVRACLNSGWVTQGPRVTEFETAMASRHACAHALATTSCTAALHLAMMALDIGPGDEVIVPAFTWVTSASAAEYVGARVVFADVDLATYNIDVAAVEAAITPATRAIVAVHLFGLAAEMDALRAIATQRGVAIIEDAACGIGTTYKGAPVGALGALGCFSFHPRKVVTTGEGGMVTTNDERLAARVATGRNHGSTGAPPDAEEPHGPWTMATFNSLGYNLRLSDIQAAIGCAQMAKLDSLLAERRACVGRYIAGLNDIEDLILPVAGDAAGHSYQSFVVRLSEGGRARRNAVMTALADDGISTRPGTHAVHRLGYYARKYNLSPADFPNAATAEDTTITLPIFPGMTADDQTRVTRVLQRALNAQ